MRSEPLIRNGQAVALTVLAALALSGAGVGSSTAHAQFDVQRFKPSPNQQDEYFTVHSTHTLQAGRYELGLLVDYANDPLVVLNSKGKRAFSLVSSQATANVMAAVGLTDQLEAGLAVPLVLAQSGDAATPAGVPSAPGAGFGIGDLHLVLRYALIQQDTKEDPGGFGLALAADAFLPTGKRADFQGEGFRIAPRVIADYAFSGGLRLSAEAGYMVRPKVALLGTEINDTLSFGVGADLPLDAGRVFHVLGEITGDVSVLAKKVTSSEVPLETIVGGRYFHSSGVMAEAGFGFGLNGGFGTPDYRILGGITYRPPLDDDRDHDGYKNDKDGCPDDPEDFDHFEDADGCSDPDNDKDGVLDAQDKCPNDAEDKDGFEDADGCPDPDNDHDGIADANDRCPSKAEDTDEFEDTDGCPEPDNDNDGILDADDECPNDAEDKDEFEDMNGCPDPDNDKDGILDAKDKCPNKAEDFDGFEDEDGCAEEGSGLVALTCEKIDIKDKVFFDTGSDRIQERSFKLLDQVASVLKSATYIKKMRVEGHTDNRGSAASNLDLSKLRAAAVLKYLVDHGVEAARLDSEGFGMTRPIADNKTDKGRADNRRVDFVIVEQDAACKK
jgi:outer membrane protein OmpA-like peptidoglycan-associated protein